MTDSKAKATMSIDPYVWDQFKNETGSASGKVEELMKTWLNTSGNDQTELINRKDELEGELEDIENKIKKLEARKSNIESELESVESALEQANNEQERINDAVDALAPKLEKKRRSHKDLEKGMKDLASSQEFHQWADSLEIGIDELKEELVSEVKA